MEVNVNVLIGKTIKSIEGANKDSEHIIIKTTDGDTYQMYHEQDCCEQVWLEDVSGSPEDLVGSPVVRAEENSNEEKEGKYGDTRTWTFYRIATAKGLVVLRWCGESNGYYSESVMFWKGTRKRYER